jgi:hypothetical protein
MCVVKKVQLWTISHFSKKITTFLVGKWCEIINMDLCSTKRLETLQLW